MELLGMKSDSTLGAKYLQEGIPDFFLYLQEKSQNLRKFATKIMAMFGFTYVCEQLFSFMKLTKTSLAQSAGTVEYTDCTSAEG